MSYLSRSSAAIAAQRKWPGAFMTWFDSKVSAWYNKEIMKTLPDEALAWEKTDFVHHVEWTTGYEHERLTGEKVEPSSALYPCLVVSCRRDEITETIPDGYLMQPLSRELWRDISDSTHTPGTRARSEIESPVKVVWRIAEEMKGADRKSVIAACVEAGVNKSTASTQYYKWQQSQKGS